MLDTYNRNSMKSNNFLQMKCHKRIRPNKLQKCMFSLPINILFAHTILEEVHFTFFDEFVLNYLCIHIISKWPGSVYSSIIFQKNTGGFLICKEANTIDYLSMTLNSWIQSGGQISKPIQKDLTASIVTTESLSSYFIKP
jgi:hypothetical protein